MNNHIYPCLWFDGNAETAARFYCSIFKNSTVKICTPMLVSFELNGNRFMGLNGGPIFKFNPAVSFFVKCNSIDAANAIWNKLLESGKALMPLDKYPWSEHYGWVQDKFGLTWQLMFDTANEQDQTITPALLFTGNQFGNAATAIDFYTSIFDNASKDMMACYPDEDANAGKLMYADFTLNRHRMIAMDGPGVHDCIFNEAVSLVVDCETQEEIDYYWNNLTKGGEESQCGWLKDQFGISWQIVPAVLGKLMTDPERAPRVMQAFMQMKKFDIEKLMDA
jgi:predicted 3-demethylubiquinone-9 3-methyltransferase (glyoxalase superfamily)